MTTTTVYFERLLSALDSMRAASPTGQITTCSVCERFAPLGQFNEFGRGQGVRHAWCLPPSMGTDYDPLTDGDHHEQERQNRADWGLLS